MKWQIKSLDIKTAFLQGETIDRTVYVKPPPEAKTDKLWRLRKCVYGLADAPRTFYNLLKEGFTAVGVKVSSLDAGLFFLHDDKNELIGIVACHVDDLLYGGTEEFQHQVIEMLRSKLDFKCEHSRAFQYLGVNIKQHEDMSITLDQSTYVDSMYPVVINEDRYNLKYELLNESEKTQYRGAIGKLNWLATMSHPELSFDVCQASSKVKTATVEDILKLNKVIMKVKKECRYIHFPSLHIPTLHIKLYTDASFNNLPNSGSQEASIVFLCDNMNRCSPITWSSRRAKRTVRSTLAAETLALNDGCDEAFYISKLFKEIMPSQNDLQIIAITDNKSAVDAIQSSNQVDDSRLRLEIASLREYQEKFKIQFHHIRGEHQISDGLTKQGASCKLLLSVLQTGHLPSQ